MIRVLQKTRKGVYRWIDGRTGYPIHKPTLDQLKKDAAGRPRYDSAKSRMVPAIAIAQPAREAVPVVNRTRVWKTTDRKKKQGFWYWKESGRRATKPGLNDIEYTKDGRPRDDTNKPIPKWSYKVDIIKPSKVTTKTKPKKFAPELPRKSAKLDPVFSFPEVRTGVYPEIEPTKFTNYSHGNRTTGENLPEVFAEAFTGHIEKGPFEPGDVDIYKYGMQIRMDRRLSQTEQRDITKYLGNFPGTSIQYIEEERVTTFLVVWGDNEEPEFARDVFRQLEQKKQQVRNLLEYFDEYGDYYDWWCWFDTADELYEFGH